MRSELDLFYPTAFVPSPTHPKRSLHLNNERTSALLRTIMLDENTADGALPHQERQSHREGAGPSTRVTFAVSTLEEEEDLHRPQTLPLSAGESLGDAVEHAISSDPDEDAVEQLLEIEDFSCINTLEVLNDAVEKLLLASPPNPEVDVEDAAGGRSPLHCTRGTPTASIISISFSHPGASCVRSSNRSSSHSERHAHEESFRVGTVTLHHWWSDERRWFDIAAVPLPSDSSSNNNNSQDVASPIRLNENVSARVYDATSSSVSPLPCWIAWCFPLRDATKVMTLQMASGGAGGGGGDDDEESWGGSWPSNLLLSVAACGSQSAFREWFSQQMKPHQKRSHPPPRPTMIFQSSPLERDLSVHKGLLHTSTTAAQIIREWDRQRRGLLWDRRRPSNATGDPSASQGFSHCVTRGLCYRVAEPHCVLCVERYVVEIMEACLPSCRFLTDVTDVFHHLIGLKSRLVPIHLTVADDTASGKDDDISHADEDWGDGTAEDDDDEFGESHRSRQKRRRHSAVVLGGVTWGAVEHRFGLWPSPRRCDWEDRMEYHWNQWIQWENDDVDKGDVSLSVGFRPMCTVNPVERIDIILAWPWLDCADIEDGTVGSAFDWVTGCRETTSREVTTHRRQHKPLPPHSVHLRVQLKNRYEFSHSCGELLRQIAYCAVVHMERIADDAVIDGAIQGAPPLHMRLSHVQVADLAARVVAAPPASLPGHATTTSRMAHAAATENDAANRRAFFVMLQLPPGHVFLRFAHACRFIEEPDDVHRLWIAVIDLLRAHCDGTVGVTKTTANTSDASSSLAVAPIWLTRICGPISGDTSLKSTLATVNPHAPMVIQKLQLMVWAGLTLAGGSSARTNGFSVPSRASVTGDGWDDSTATPSDVDEDEDGLLFECESSASAAGGSDGGDGVNQMPSAEGAPVMLKLLLCPGKQLYPVERPYCAPPVTSDDAEVNEREMLKLGDSKQGRLLRLQRQCRQLYIDMCLFLHANAVHLSDDEGKSGVVDGPEDQERRRAVARNVHHYPVLFADFVRWHSPKDFQPPVGHDDAATPTMEKWLHQQLLGSRDAQGGHDEEAVTGPLLSRRMRSHRIDGDEEQNIWWSLWRSASPQPLVVFERQDELYASEALMRTFDWLENHYTPEELLKDVITAAAVHAAQPILSMLSPYMTSAGVGVAAHISKQLLQVSRCIDDLHVPGSLPPVDLHTESDTYGSRVCGWSRERAAMFRASASAAITAVEMLEESYCTVFAVHDLLFGAAGIPNFGSAAPATTSVPPLWWPAAVGLVGDLLRRPWGEGDDDRQPSATIAVPMELWLNVIQPLWQRRHGTTTPEHHNDASPSSYTTASNQHCAGITVPISSATDPLPVLKVCWAQSHLLCAAERPMQIDPEKRLPPLLQRLHATWIWGRAPGDEGTQRIVPCDACGVSAVRVCDAFAMETPMVVIRSCVAEYVA